FLRFHVPDSRLRGNDEILSWGNLSENPQPQKTGRMPHHPPPNPDLTIQTNQKKKQNEQNIPHHLE
ncbi:TPA: hypothetical protein ACP528_001961, partial [Neisseria meningitidis]